MGAGAGAGLSRGAKWLSRGAAQGRKWWRRAGGTEGRADVSPCQLRALSAADLTESLCDRDQTTTDRDRPRPDRDELGWVLCQAEVRLAW